MLQKFLLLIIIGLNSISSLSQKIEQIQKVDTSKFISADTLKGKLITIDWQSTFLEENRNITIYEPPNYDPNVKYGVVYVTDGMCEILSSYVDVLISKKQIEPILIVGLNPREIQKKDSIIAEYNVDFRAIEYLKIAHIFSEIPIPASEVPDFVRNRYGKFSLYLLNEVIPYMDKHYSIVQDKSKWTLGGFSNGGGFCMYFTIDHPIIFGKVISMSPADINPPGTKYSFSKEGPYYFICAGQKEENFHQSSVNFMVQIHQVGLPFIHYTYDRGHDFYMWLDAYLKAIKDFY